MKPLAETLRPKDLQDFCAQTHLLNDAHPLKQAINNKQLHSMILWGPSGVGKTTLARIMCAQVEGYFVQLSAVLDGVKELRAVIENAKKYISFENDKKDLEKILINIGNDKQYKNIQFAKTVYSKNLELKDITRDKRHIKHTSLSDIKALH